MYDVRRNFCACAFMDKIFIIGGVNINSTNSSLQFDTKDYSWNEVARMNQSRGLSACEVYEERIVVAGGYDDVLNELNTVESYDVLPDRWSPMPNMISGKYRHSLVVVKSKLFVIGRNPDTNEVLDNICKKFVAIKSPQISSFGYLRLNHAISIGNKIVLFQDDKPVAMCYDVDKEEWSEEQCEVTNRLEFFSCVKIPCH